MAKRKATTEELERVNFILDRARKMQEAKDYYARNWPEYERIWRLTENPKQGEDAWRETLPDKWAFATIKTAQAAFSDSKIKPKFTRHEDDDSMRARDLTDLYEDISEKGSIDQEMYYVRNDAFRLGMGFFETLYVEDKRQVYSIETFDPDTNDFKYEIKEIKDFDDPKTIRVSPYLVLVDEMATADFETTARDYIKIEVMSKDDAKRKYGHLIENWDERIKAKHFVSQALDNIKKTGIATTADNLKRQETGVKDFRFFAPFDIADDAVEVWIYTSKNMGVRGTDTREIVISGEPVLVDTKRSPAPIPYIHKRLPLTPVPYSPRSGDEFWAMGIIEIGKSDITTIRKHREMMADRQKLSLFSPAFSDVKDEIDARSIRMKPLAIIRTRGGAPKQYQIPGITNADLLLQDYNEKSFKQAVGIDERVLGVTDQGNITATEATYLREAALKRLKEFSDLYKLALNREIRLKISLFEQYYSSPFKKEPRVRSDAGLKALAQEIKKFKVKVGNVYKQRAIHKSLFEGDIDVDVEARYLLPLTQAQMITKWAQAMRDILPLGMQGIVDIDAEKIIDEYLNALEIDINSLRKDEDSDAITMAEGEHQMFASENVKQEAIDKILPNGTPLQFLTAKHIKRHQELLRSDMEMTPERMKLLASHIEKDLNNLNKKLEKQVEEEKQKEAMPAVHPSAPPMPQPIQQPKQPQQTP